MEENTGKHACPPVGTPLLCLVCAYERPWQIFDSNTGASFCRECWLLLARGQREVAVDLMAAREIAARNV